MTNAYLVPRALASTAEILATKRIGPSAAEGECLTIALVIDLDQVTSQSQLRSLFSSLKAAVLSAGVNALVPATQVVVAQAPTPPRPLPGARARSPYAPPN